jgi:uncharacterized repeat protein (TIGR02543 family)
MILKLNKIALILAAVVGLTACNGSSQTNDVYNVYFFTANQNATILDPIIDQEPGSLITPPENPERSGFDFIGWYLDVQLTTPWDFETDVMPETSIVLYAKWEVGIRDIIYILNGGTISTENYPTTYFPGQNVVLPQARRVGYTFKGWFSYDQDFVTYPNSEGTKPGDKPVISIGSAQFEDVTVYAHWAVIQTNVSFRSSHPDGTTVVANPGTIRVPYNTIIQYGVNFPADFGTVAGYRFLGWNSKADGTGDWYINGTLFLRTSPITIYGQWQPVA